MTSQPVSLLQEEAGSREKIEPQSRGFGLPVYAIAPLDCKKSAFGGAPRFCRITFHNALTLVAPRSDIVKTFAQVYSYHLRQHQYGPTQAELKKTPARVNQHALTLIGHYEQSLRQEQRRSSRH